MAEFCEGCPLAGDVQGEIDEIEHLVLARSIGTLFGTAYGQPKSVAILRDAEINPSRPIEPANHQNRDILRQIDQCQGVETVEQKRLFREPVMRPHCPALGRLAVARGSELYNHVASRVLLANK